MPITKSAQKALRVSKRRRVFNTKRAEAVKKTLRELKKKIDEKDKKGALALLPNVYQAIDKATKKGVIQKNNAARKKARAANLVKKIS